ncbi:MAG: hypothetical protein ACYDEF_10305 [Methanosarcina sp.]
MSWLPLKAAVSAAVPAYIGYRDEDIFRVSNKIGIFRWNNKTPVEFAYF